jgi:serine/threonine protein kinase
MVAGKFKILALVAAGGMGKVYRAEQIPLGRAVALKVLHVHATDSTDGDDPQFKKRFLREASILSKLQHPNIVTVFDYGSIEGESERYFMAMEFLSGQTLTRRITEKGVLAPRDTIKIARQIARGLTEAHATGIIHRDLKPSNVMLLIGRDGEDLAKIVDFGIVKLIGDDDSQEHEDLTQEGSFIGSPKYMAPEQITRGGKIDARTDIYSFGIILYQCLTGTVPFDGASSVQTLMAHLNQAPQPMRERVPNLEMPEWLDQLVMSCIEKDPERRPQTMDTVARALGEAEAAMNSGRVLPSSLTGQMAAPSFGPRASSPDTLASSGSGALVSQSGRHASITTQGTISSVAPGAVSGDDKTRTSPGMKKGLEKRSRVPYVVAALVFLTIGGGTIFAFLPRTHPDAPPPAQALPSPPLVPVPSGVPSAAPAVDQFALTVDSIPSGADVREGDRVLGITPLVLTIDNSTVSAAPRTFTVAKDGFQPYALAQGASQTSVRLIAPLVAATPAALSPHAPAHHAPSHAQPSPTPSTTGRPDLDIRLNR